MKRIVFVIVALIAFAPIASFAQVPPVPVAPSADKTPPMSSSSLHSGSSFELQPLQPTPEMWFYEQEQKRREDPNAMARARAERVGNERQARLAALRWYGISNSRPLTGTDPVHGVWAPHWTGNGTNPDTWYWIGNGNANTNAAGAMIYSRSRRY
jgi:hypothetical protein